MRATLEYVSQTNPSLITDTNYQNKLSTVSQPRLNHLRTFQSFSKDSARLQRLFRHQEILNLPKSLLKDLASSSFP